MKAITIKQPWATLIAIGAKQFETRSWKTKYRGLLAIHAGKTVDKVACEIPAIKEVLEQHGYTAKNLPVGCIVAKGTLSGCYRLYDTVDQGKHIVRCPDTKYDFDKVHYIHQPESLFGFYEGTRFVWELSDIEKLLQPVPAKGQLSLWNWEPPTE